MAEKACKAMSLLKLAEERASMKKKLDEQKRKQQLDSVPYLPKDCVSNILIRLPIESLQQSRFVCKPWYSIIKSPTFIRDNLHRAPKVMIFLSLVKGFLRGWSDQDSALFHENPNTFSVESKIFDLKSVHMLHRPLICSSSKYAIKYMVLEDGKGMIRDYNATCMGKIRASCDGLIVVDNMLRKGELVIMNPVTRELNLLPLGTICPPHDESFGLVCCARWYKLVHLFRDESQFIGCEVLQIGEKSWRVIDGPAFRLMKWFGYDPVFAIGALHWVPELDHNEHIVTMTIEDEKFHTIMLPKTSRFNDRIMEAYDRLCFVTHEEINEISIWALERLSGEAWTKIYTIAVGCIRDLIPLYFSRFKWELYFLDKDGSVFGFDFENVQMKKFTTMKGCFMLAGAEYTLTLHANSLVSWQIKEDDRDDAIYS
ncbi:hypothetical protein L1987_12217 [Smallanthus sonchifolius]|uniref:Uncharacterized protein n=1 Tax=Smallanthus sonchifolius TaxID=185202 RepID=A0ACB9JFB1_9ASTR|nr:hypothetical protein L1987_12217 [Smallanthus sonchifolius]